MTRTDTKEVLRLLSGKNSRASLKGCIGKTTSEIKYQVEHGTFPLGKSTTLVFFVLILFTISNRKKHHIVFIVIVNVTIFFTIKSLQVLWKIFLRDIAILQIAALITSHRLLRCQVVFNKRL